MSNYLLECVDCGHQYVESEVEYLCPECSKKMEHGKSLPGVLKVVYDLESISNHYPKLPENMEWWELLWPILEGEGVVDFTPLRTALRLGASLGLENLYLKDDTSLMSGSFKDRASKLVVARAYEKNINKIVAASTGNAASSLASISAEEGFECVLIVPESAPEAKLVQMAACGAKVIRVKGSYDDAYEVSLDLTKNLGWYNRNTAFNPYTIEGKKTAAYEIWEQNGREAPDVVIIPTGDGAILAGVAKGFEELEKLGWIERRPRMIAVQPSGSDSIVSAFENNLEVPVPIKEAKSVADSLCVAAPRNGKWALKEIRDSDGFAVRVTDEEILKAIPMLGSMSGVFAEPAAAASIAALKGLLNDGKIESDENIVVLVTGTGLKDVGSAAKSVDFLKPIKPDWKEVEKIIK